METKTKVIVVDDEESICRNVEKILQKQDFEVARATSAQEALDKMAQDSYSLLISDIVMPGKNGLELLKMAKENWPLTKAIMMTAYASTDTAMKAIRLGALDYLPKPFTPDELRGTVEKALSGEMMEVKPSVEERESINVIDVDLPFDPDEVARATGEDYVSTLGRSDMPTVAVPTAKSLEHFCEVGDMVCDIYKKLGDTCKAGVKTHACPQKSGKKDRKAAKGKAAPDVRQLVGIDMPFDYNEVAAVTGPEYVRNLHGEGVAFMPYDEVKRKYQALVGKAEPASAPAGAEAPEPVEQAAGALENFCEVGNMVCDIYKKLGDTCKAGIKTAACPRLKSKKKARKARTTETPDVSRLVGLDMPFDFEEVSAVAGPQYALHMTPDGFSPLPYEQIKADYEGMRAAEKKAARIPDAEPAQGTAPILVIDDEVAVNNNMRKILTKKGFSVDQATTRDEALQKINERDYAIALLDLKIPGVKGLELLQAIRDKNPETRVIIVTGYASIETAVEGARMGAVAYLPKPFTPDEIRRAAGEALRMAA